MVSSMPKHAVQTAFKFYYICTKFNQYMDVGSSR